MSPRLRVYYNAVVGGLAGLFTWLLVGLLVPAETAITARNLLSGSITGLVIGSAIGCLDGVFSRTTRRAVTGAAIGGLLGLAGGALGLSIAESAFSVVKGGLVGRSLGWAILGIGIGLGESLLARSARKTSYSVLGGLIGGLAGGFTLQLLLRGRMGEAFATALARVILGACIGAFIGLIQEALKRAWVLVVRGRPEGREYILYKRANAVGSSDQCEVLLFGPDIPKRAALIRQDGGSFQLDTQGNAMAVNSVPASGRVRLNDGDRIELGRSALLFRTKGGAR